MSLGFIAGGIAIATAGASIIQSRKAAKQQKAANATARRQENVRALRERQQTIRSQRIANASALTAGTNAGVAGSSMMQGAMASFNTQAAGNMNFVDQMNALTVQRMQQIASAENYQNSAGMWQQASQLAQIGGSLGRGSKSQTKT